MRTITTLFLILVSSLLFAGEWVIPVVAHAEGAYGSNWVTDLYLATDGQSHTLTFTYIPTSSDGTQVNYVETKSVTHTVEIIPDVIATLFGLEDGNGWILISSEEEGVGIRISSRIYNQTEEGSYGQYAPALSMNEILPGQALFLPGAQHSDYFRTNLGLVNTGESAGSVIISAYDHTGEQLFSFSHTLLPMEHIQFNSILATYHVFDLNDGFFILTPEASMPLVAYTSIVDKMSGDAIYIPGEPSPSNNRNYLLPVVTHAQGGYQTFWQSDLWILNPGADNVTLTFSMNGEEAEQLVTPMGSLYISDVMKTLFGETSATEELWMSADQSAPIILTSRTYTRDGDKTFGQQIPGYALAQGKGFYSHTLLFPVIKDGAFRTNFGVVNGEDEDAVLHLTLVDADGNSLGTSDLAVPARQLTTIIDLPGHFGLGGLATGALRIEGDAQYTAYLSVVDNTTGDAIYVPGLETPEGGTTTQGPDFAFTVPDEWEASTLLAYETGRLRNTMVATNGNAYLSAAVTNLGSESAVPTLALLVDGVEMARRTLDHPLSPGEVWKVTDIQVSLTAGTHNLAIVLDPDGAVDEANENNNLVTREEECVNAALTLDMTPMTPKGWVAPLVINYDPADHNFATLIINTVTYAHFVVGNTMNLATTVPFEVDLFADGNLIGEYIVDDSLADNATWSMDGIPLTLDLGDHTVSIQIDPYHRLWENTTGNNIFSRAFTYTSSFFSYVNLMPYLPQGWDYPIVPSAGPGTHIVSSFLPKNQPTYIDIALRNDGTADITTPFTVSLLLDGTEIQAWTVNELDRGDIFTVEDFTYTVVPGSHELRLIVDGNDDVAEVLENDNEWAMTFRW